MIDVQTVRFLCKKPGRVRITLIRYDAEACSVEDDTLNDGGSSHCVPGHSADWAVHSEVNSGTSRLKRKHCPSLPQTSLDSCGSSLSGSNTTTRRENSCNNFVSHNNAFDAARQTC